MTIGVAASGPQAGAAVQAAALAAEAMGHGAIGGFAVFAVMDDAGRVRHRWCQRGGVTALNLPPDWLQAPRAALIESGPDRPEPLVQFLPGADGVGLVTGHRLPNRPGTDGIALNQAALGLMAAGAPPGDAVGQVLQAHPEIDAGLIALSAAGELAWGNTRRVARRPDQGLAHRDNGLCRVAVLHNSIHPCPPLADAMADLAWYALTGESAPYRALTLGVPVAITAAARDRVLVDAQGRILAIEQADPSLPSAPRRANAIYLGSEVWQDGRHIGHTVSELTADMADGRVYGVPDPARSLIIMKE
ncbi:DUF6963 family protein [Achromobacter marplatensis]|uniref:Uncharacterized protein n=1 Tax=Achromobacter marplatensis TaxID=470868 RepID=A0AA42WI18_9BURK|nr:hypothetical protein [Achromobacter marplatensis]MDH2054631.1 hypothetical protein [Achromobacter marplatensis]